MAEIGVWLEGSIGCFTVLELTIRVGTKGL